MARSYSRVSEPHRVLKVDAHEDYQRGEDVRALQAAANRRLRARGLDGYVVPEDGEYGPRTALACRKATWALGALLATVTNDRLSIGAQRMIRYPGRRVAAQLARATARIADLVKSRKAADAKRGSREKAVAWAKAQVGTTENPPGSNRGGRITTWQQNFGSWLVGLAWCGVFVGNALRAGGVKDVSARIASVAFIEDDAKAHRGPFRGWVSSGAHGVMHGDLAVIGGRGVHVELVVKAYADGSADTVGGNTSPGRAGSQSNGGGVFARHRSAGEVYGFALVNYPG